MQKMALNTMSSYNNSISSNIYKPMPDQVTTTQDELLNIMFTQAPMGLATFDHTFNLRRFNVKWADLVRQLAPTDPNPVTEGQPPADSDAIRRRNTPAAV
jgi:hypothetical protein